MPRYFVHKNQTRPVGVYNKDPDDVRWVEIVWDFWLGSDTISTVTWLIDDETQLDNGDDLSIDATEDDQSVGNYTHVNRAKVSGGFSARPLHYVGFSGGRYHRVTNRVETTQGETKDVTMQVFVREQ